MEELTVIDFFCGAGGFSEGFRQQGFKIILGIDSWQPAIDTFNYNFDLDCKARNILDFDDDIKKIEALPDTDIIIGSPPCVSFSHSNNSGKADKQTGIHLTEVYFKIIAVKKFKKNSILKAWYMENVANSIKYLKKSYTFLDLGLEDWATRNSLDAEQKAIILENNQFIINSADYGSPQKRKRLISGEIIQKGGLEIPPVTNGNLSGQDLIDYKTLAFVKKMLPSPFSPFSEQMIVDPLYPEIKIKASDLIDHFYDTGLYKSEWRQSRYLKINHPYMGIMSFPENEDNPSRTIMATKIGSSREAIIYKSESIRIGDGEYRTPTVREAASIMSFPITYQFKGSEGIKWRLVGNAVCPTVSRAFAKQLKMELGLNVIETPNVKSLVDHDGINNLNSYNLKAFNDPPKRTKNSPFRRHPFKVGNLTVTLSNYNIEKKEKVVKKWITSIQYGNGEGFPTYNIPDNYHIELEQVIKKIKHGEKFLQVLNNGFSEKIAKAKELQLMYELQKSNGQYLEPTELIEAVASLIQDLDVREEFKQDEITVFRKKESVPVKQIFALYAINKISSFAND
jgi:DNA (cytosine-5)-methyltransferase 1